VGSYTLVKHTQILEVAQISISKERNMFVAEHFISNLVKRYGEHPVSTDGSTWYHRLVNY
jgi:putative transposase